MKRARLSMFYYAVKRQIFYRTPNAILSALGNRDGIYCLYEKTLAKSPGHLKKLTAWIAFLLSVLSSPAVGACYVFLIFVMRRVYLPRVEVCLTTYCTLRCKDCSNLIQYYQKPYHIPASDVVSDIDTLLFGIDELEQLVFLGGEPFIYPELHKVLQYAVAQDKIKSIRIITNGIFKPDTALAELLAHRNVRISISDYGMKGAVIDENCQWFIQNHITFGRQLQKDWVSMGDMTKRNRSSALLRRQYTSCRYKCKCILSGKLYVCPRESHGMDLGLIKGATAVDLRNDWKHRRNEFTEQLLNLYFRRDFIAACDYCDAGTVQCVQIPCGIQAAIAEKTSPDSSAV